MSIREIDPNTGEQSGWFWVSMGLIFGHFFFPFLYLLFYHNKINGPRLIFIVSWILVFHLLDLYWNIIPGREIAPGSVCWLRGSSSAWHSFDMGII